MVDGEDLFTVTDKHLDTGLRGIPVGTCQTSYVDPIEGIHYVGYPVEDLVDLEEEDVIFLLMYKRLPSDHESKEFRAELAQRGKNIPTGALRVLESLTPGSGIQWIGIDWNNGSWYCGDDR